MHPALRFSRGASLQRNTPLFPPDKGTFCSAKPQGPAVFSADYKGCHVLEKVGSTHCSGSGGGRQGDLQLGASLA